MVLAMKNSGLMAKEALNNS